MHEFSPEKAPKKNKTTAVKPIAISLIVIAALGSSFFGGVQFQKSKAPVTAASTENQMQLSGNAMPGGRVMMRGGIFGEVTAVSSTSITIKADSGDSTTLTISSSTSILDGGESATIDSIKTGDRVIVTKDTSDTGLAKRIIVNPAMNGPQSSAQGTNDQSTDTETPTTYTN